MTPKASKLYKAANKNKDFLKIFESEGDQPPGFFAGEAVKVTFGAVYYGYLLGKYGIDWADHV